MRRPHFLRGFTAAQPTAEVDPPRPAQQPTDPLAIIALELWPLGVVLVVFIVARYG